MGFGFTNEEDYIKYSTTIRTLKKSYHIPKPSVDALPEFISNFEPPVFDKTKKLLVFTELDQIVVKIDPLLEEGEDNPQKTTRTMVSFRPYALEVLMALRKKFQIAVYSAQDKAMLEQIVQIFEQNNDSPEPLFQLILDKQCLGDKYYRTRSLKLLEKMGANPKETVFVGSNPQDFRGIEKQALPIKGWRGAEDDDLLVKLMNYLLHVIGEGTLADIVEADLNIFK